MQYCGSKVNAKQNKCGTDNTSDFIVDSFTTTKCKKKGGGASLVAQIAKNLPAMQETWVQHLG